MKGKPRHINNVSVNDIALFKGLEFDRVFIVGMEEGLFPSGASGEEEESKKNAVWLMSALLGQRKKLTLCYAEQRRVYSQEEKRIVSRFINELPEENIPGNSLTAP